MFCVIKKKNNKNNMIENKKLLVPILSYSDPYEKKKLILKENRGKAGIYKWTHKESGKHYIGSSVNLSKRIGDYLNLHYLNKEIVKSESCIYKSILKYGHSNFILDIIEYCEHNKDILLNREQYYIDLLKPEYNILQKAGSVLGFKHSKSIIEYRRLVQKGRIHTEETKLKMAMSNIKAKPVVVTNNRTNEGKEFVSIARAAKYIKLYHSRSLIAGCLRKKNIYRGRLYTIIFKSK